jgi:hypothetical protein
MDAIVKEQCKNRIARVQQRCKREERKMNLSAEKDHMTRTLTWSTPEARYYGFAGVSDILISFGRDQLQRGTLWFPEAGLIQIYSL